MKNETALDQANIQMDSIRAMVAAINVDYDRLEELNDMGEDIDHDERMERIELTEQANGNETADDAQRAICDDALEVSVRSGWVSIGDKMEAEEFRILLCTGGPTVAIRGELGHTGEPKRAWLEYQDWKTPMAARVNQPGDQDALLSYAEHYIA